MSLSGGTSIPFVSSSQVVDSDTRGSAGTTAIYTVTTGKTLYITSVWMTWNTPLANVVGQVKIGATVLYQIQTAAGGTGSGFVPFGMPVRAASGTAINLTTDAGGDVYAGFTGYEV